MERPKSMMLSVFLLALAVLLIEVCLTRVFSVLSWHHFAYLIISLALLGFGAAGSYLTVSKRFADDVIDPAPAVPSSCSALECVVVDPAAFCQDTHVQVTANDATVSACVADDSNRFLLRKQTTANVSVDPLP